MAPDAVKALLHGLQRKRRLRIQTVQALARTGESLMRTQRRSYVAWDGAAQYGYTSIGDGLLHPDFDVAGSLGGDGFQ